MRKGRSLSRRLGENGEGELELIDGWRSWLERVDGSLRWKVCWCVYG